MRAVAELATKKKEPWALERLLKAIGDRDDSVAKAAFDAVSSAALNAEARRHDAPPPLPRISSSEVDIVLSEDDLIELDPTEEPPRRLTVAELLEEDPD